MMKRDEKKRRVVREREMNKLAGEEVRKVTKFSRGENLNSKTVL